jgi:threonine synthase
VTLSAMSGAVNEGLIARYRDWLPTVTKNTEIVSLIEGSTPLVPLRNITEHFSRDVRVFAKFEGLNPTGSFKDRGMTMAVTQAVGEGSKAIICASTGNTSASAAAYAARAGIKSFVLIPAGKIAMGKLAQAMIHGADIIQISGSFDDGMKIVRELGENIPVTIVNSVNPYRLEGQKTAAFEIVDELGRAPDYHCLPVGNAGNISAYWKGFSEYYGAFQSNWAEFKYPSPRATNRPVLVGYQAAGAAPFISGGPIARPETLATAIRIGNPQSWDLAWAASKESGGWFDILSDQEILGVQRLLAEKEGLFCEPASAVSVGGALRDIKSGKIPDGSVVTCTLTGHGLKDPDTAIQQSGVVLEVPAQREAVRKVILDGLVPEI